MPGTRKRRLSALMIAGLVGLLAAGCNGTGGTSAAPSTAVDQQARNDIEKINKYLGTALDNSETEKALLPTLNKNNDYLRNVIKKMQCDIYDLQHNTHNCPGIGGGSTSPTNVPKYPQ